MTTILTPAQTCGPLFGFALFPEGLAGTIDAAAEDAVTIEGTIRDGAGETVGYGALIEFWARGQACRARTLDGNFRISVRKPAPESTPGGILAASFGILIFTRGLALPLVTRMYFPDQPANHAADPVMQAVPERLRERMIARAGPDARTLIHDIHLQGPRESVFFAFGDD